MQRLYSINYRVCALGIGYCFRTHKLEVLCRREEQEREFEQARKSQKVGKHQ